jgi:beta-lactamase class A
MIGSNTKKLLIMVGVVVLFVAGYFAGFNDEQTVLARKFTSIRPLRSNDASYKFINPLLLYFVPSADQQWGLTDMKNQVQKIIDSDKKSNNISNASVFFQDLNLGRWIGINQSDQYNPASMLKVVIMVSYYKKSEDSPDLLAQFLTYTTSIDRSVKADPSNQPSGLVIGKSYQVDDLIKRMIIDSDNGAALLLLNSIDQASINSVYSALGIPSPDSAKGDFTISPRYYSFFFRVLYSATYLNDANSEKALNILSKSNFEDGIVSGVSQNIVVAHKYGERVLPNSDQVELHDCGIVYYPKDPYLLCIMTRGDNLNNLKSVIEDISSVVYRNYSKIKETEKQL